MTDEKFSIEEYYRSPGEKLDWVKQGAGKGAIDFLSVLKPRWNLSQVCYQLATLFPEQKDGVILELVNRQTSWVGLLPAIPTPETTRISAAPPILDKTDLEA